MNIEVIKNCRGVGFDMAMLRGIYDVKTIYALVIYYYESIDVQSLNQFIKFGIVGNYSLLISQDELRYSNTLSTLVMKKYGLFLPALSFRVVFFDNKILQLIKSDVSGTGGHAYREILTKALDHKFKVGGYPLKLLETQLVKIRFRNIFNNPTKRYFKYANPDIENREIKKSVTIAVLGYVGITFMAKVIDYFIR